MLGHEKLIFNNEISKGHKKMNSKQNLHKLGVNYICNLLEQARFKILQVNVSPDHHFQLLAEVNDKSMLIAVRTDQYPIVGSIDEKTEKWLIKEAEQLNAVPHFAGLTVKPLEANEIQSDGVTEGQKYQVIFSGISVVHNPDSIAANS